MTYKDLEMEYHRRKLRACLSPALNVRDEKKENSPRPRIKCYVE